MCHLAYCTKGEESSVRNLAGNVKFKSYDEFPSILVIIANSKPFIKTVNPFLLSEKALQLERCLT